MTRRVDAGSCWDINQPPVRHLFTIGSHRTQNRGPNLFSIFGLTSFLGGELVVVFSLHLRTWFNRVETGGKLCEDRSLAQNLMVSWTKTTLNGPKGDTEKEIRALPWASVECVAYDEAFNGPLTPCLGFDMIGDMKGI